VSGLEVERTVPLRWRDIDALGHVNNAVFLSLLEVARDALYTAVLGGPDYVVARVEIDFTAEVRYSEGHVVVRATSERVGSTSLTTREQVLLPSGEVAAEALVVGVRWDKARQAAVPFTDEQRALLAAGS